MRARRLLSLLIATLIVVGSIGNVYGQTLHEITKTQTVTLGVEHSTAERLTSLGWQNINVLKIDLNNENVVLKPLEAEALGERQTVLEMATGSGAVAGVNADFFDMAASPAPSFGAVIEDGKTKHTYNSNYTNLGPKKNMATFMVDENKNLLMDYYSMNMYIEIDGMKLCDISAYNIFPGSFNVPVVIDSRYYSSTEKFNNKYRAQGVYTVIVTEDEVTYVSLQDEVVDIPEGSYALIMNNNSASKYLPLLSIGTQISLQQTIQLKDEMIDSIEQMQFGIGGGGLIMKDGQPYGGAAHKVSPDSREPRTILGTTQNEGEILLIAIDGRNKLVGASHSDLIKILQEYGVKDAMYLDGGGSTTLVAREEGENEPKVQNTPSEGTQRKVTNGIGVFSTAEKSELTKLYIEAPRDRTFVGEGITFTLKGVDKNHNPVTISEDVALSATGVTGTWKGLTFYPETEGKALIIAKKDDIEVATEIDVSSAPSALRIEPSYLQVDENTSKTVQVYGIDKEGYKIPISPEKITWTSDNNKVSASGNQVQATTKTLANLTATYKDIKANLGVVVGNTVAPIYSFEDNNALWEGDTATVKGKVEPSKDVKYHAQQSVKMTYTFDKSNTKQVAYTAFKEPVKIYGDAQTINLWVYAKGQGDTLKIQLKDATGQTHYIKLADHLKHEGWKYLSASIPSSVKLPAEINKIYAYTSSNPQKRTSTLYLDHMSITRGHQDKENIATSKDFIFDSMYKDSLQAPVGSDQYEMHIVGPTKVASMNLDKATINALTDKLQSQASMVIMATQNNLDLPFQKNAYTYKNTYERVEHNNTAVFFVGTDNGGIRATSPEQWLTIKKDLENTSAQHIILVMSKNPLTEFEDVKEGKAFHDYLSTYRAQTGKNIFVVTTGGTQKEVQIEEGIRYIRLNGLELPTDDPKQGEYLRFKVVGDQIYYTFDSMM